MDGPAPSLNADLRAAIRGLDPSLVVTQLSSLDDLISDRTARHRLAMLALTLFGATALLLCGFGLYAVVALTSQLRRREYAIRMALGAARDGVRWMVIRQALALAVSGAAIGLVIASLGTRLLEGLLLGVEPLDPVTFGGAIAAILAVAALAAWLPARRAGLVSPAETLKAE